MTRDELRSYEPLWDKWYVQEHLGGGSFGDVYRITCQVYEHTYEAALKVISIPKDQSELREVEMSCETREEAMDYYDRLRQSITNEIDMMEQLKGRTNIVSFEDHDIVPRSQGKEPGYDIFIRMELLEDFSSVIGQESRRWRDNSQIRKLGMDIAQGLQICHAHNIIHRDIKLSNIFRSRDGDFKIGDFGIAKNVSDSQLTMSVKGTFNFMAPEVYNREHYDFRSDIYSLGMVLYHLLNKNRGPFLTLTQVPTAEQKEQALIRRMSGDPMRPPIMAGPKLAEVVLKACAFDRDGRYQTMEEFYQALLALAPEDMERPENPLFDGSLFDDPTESSTGSRAEEENQTVAFATEEDDDRTVAMAEPIRPESEKMPEEQREKPEKKPKKGIAVFALLAVVVVAVVAAFAAFGTSGEKEPDVAAEAAEDGSEPEEAAAEDADAEAEDTEAEPEEDTDAAPEPEAEPEPVAPVSAGDITVTGSEENDGLIFEGDSYDTIRIAGSFQVSETDAAPVEGELVLEHEGDVIEKSTACTWVFTPADTEHYLPAEGEIWVTAIHRDRITGLDELAEVEDPASVYVLDLSGCQLKDLSILEGMDNLTVLALSDNDLTDISELANHPRLQQLYLDGNSSLKDVSPLYGLEQLQIVSLDGTKVSEKAQQKISKILVTE